MTTPTPEMPGMGQMNDTLDFMKNLWTGMKMPGVTMPSMSVEDINKQIGDLKTVESWLTLNMNMLRGTIQALEVQSATLTALQSMGQNVSEAMNSMVQAGTRNAAEANWPPEYKSSFATRAEPEPEPEPEAQAGESAEEPYFSFAPPIAEKPPAPAAESPPASNGHTDHTGDAKADGASGLTAASAPFVNPAAWWNMLQDQFSQAVNTALETAEPVARKTPARKTSGSAAGKAAKKSAPKPRSASAVSAKAGAKGATRSASKSASKSGVKSGSKTGAKSSSGTATRRKRG